MPKVPTITTKTAEVQNPTKLPKSVFERWENGTLEFLVSLSLSLSFPFYCHVYEYVSYQLIRDAKLSPNLAPKMRKLCHNLICDKTA